MSASPNFNRTEDEAARRAQAEKWHAEDDAQARNRSDADRLTPAEQEEVEQVSREQRRRARAEVSATEREIHRDRVVTRVRRVVDYAFYLVYGLIGLRILLDVVGAGTGTEFMRLLTIVTAPLLDPFRGLMGDLIVGRLHFLPSYLFALFVYVLLHVAIRGLLGLLIRRRSISS